MTSKPIFVHTNGRVGHQAKTAFLRSLWAIAARRLPDDGEVNPSSHLPCDTCSREQCVLLHWAPARPTLEHGQRCQGSNHGTCPTNEHDCPNRSSTLAGRQSTHGR